MNKLNASILLILITILLCGCVEEKNPDIATTVATESAATTSTVTESVPAQTGSQKFSECTEPPLELLDKESGSFVMRYNDEKLQDYMDYCVFIPENATHNMPLIIFLHGDGEVGKTEQMLSFGIWGQVQEIYGEKYPFIGLSPCSRIYSWTDDSVLPITMNLIEYIVSEYYIDRNRIIITGHSRGAMGTWQMISNYGPLFAGAVPVSCGPDGAVDYEKMTAVPVLAIAGTVGDDENIYNSSMRKTVKKLQEIGGNAEFIELEGIKHGKSSSAAFTRDVFEWMLSCRKEDEK